MKRTGLILGLIVSVVASGCCNTWRPYNGQTYAQPVYPQSAQYPQPAVYPQPAPVYQPAAAYQPAPMYSQAPMVQGCPPMYAQPMTNCQ